MLQQLVTTTFTNFGCKALDQLRDSVSQMYAYISRIQISDITNAFHDIINSIQDITNWILDTGMYVLWSFVYSKTAFQTSAAGSVTTDVTVTT